MEFNKAELVAAVMNCSGARLPHFAVCGGLALEFHGVRKNDGHDIDLLVEPGTFRKLWASMTWQTSDNNLAYGVDCLDYRPLLGVVKIQALLAIDSNETPAFRPWFGYLRRARPVESSGMIRVVTLEDLLTWKEAVGTESINYLKHHNDAQRIRDFMEAEKDVNF